MSPSAPASRESVLPRWLEIIKACGSRTLGDERCPGGRRCRPEHSRPGSVDFYGMQISRSAPRCGCGAARPHPPPRTVLRVLAHGGREGAVDLWADGRLRVAWNILNRRRPRAIERLTRPTRSLCSRTAALANKRVMLNVKPMEITVPARVLLLGLTVVLSSGCGLCANDEVVRIPSPDTKFEAVVFQRDCGATTGFSTQVSVVTRGASLPNEAGNVFIADTDHGKATSASWGGQPVDLEMVVKTCIEGCHTSGSTNLSQGVGDLCLDRDSSSGESGGGVCIQGPVKRPLARHTPRVFFSALL